jgi:hypothetical protein
MRPISVLLLFFVSSLLVADTVSSTSCSFPLGSTGSCSIVADSGAVATGSLNLVSGAVPDPSLILSDYPQYQGLTFNAAYGLTASLTLSGAPSQDASFNASFTLPAEYGNWLIYGDLGYDPSQGVPDAGSSVFFQTSDGNGNDYSSWQFQAFPLETQVFLAPHAPGDPLVVDFSIQTLAGTSGPTDATLYLELLADAPASVLAVSCGYDFRITMRCVYTPAGLFEPKRDGGIYGRGSARWQIACQCRDRDEPYADHQVSEWIRGAHLE